ncbi:hypothetical protein SprV_0501925100 [Sparganum proliferum]
MNVGEAAEIHPDEEEKTQITPPAPRRRKIRQPQIDFLTKEEEITEAINSEKVVEYCQAKGLLPYVVKCQCGRPMRQQVMRLHTDGYVFRCGRCRRRKALRKGSIFESSRLTIRTIMKIWLAFIRGMRVKQCAEDIRISHTTAVQWYALCRSVCSTALMNERKQIGGPGVEVQVDESLISRRRRQLWLVVNDRSWPALRAVIKKWVAKGSIIVTDEWKAYKRLPSEGYEHFTVNHTKHLKDPTTGKHTNTIETYWKRLKRKLHEGGPVSGRAIWAHVDEIQYRLWFRLDSVDLKQAWEIFLSHIADAYPLQYLPKQAT